MVEAAREAVNKASRPVGSQRARVVGWSLALLGSALLLLSGWLLIRWAESGPQPSYVELPADASPERRPKPRYLLRLAGSGSNLPLTRALADEFGARLPWARVRVAESISSSGGVRAARDRVIEVGLISRPLKDDERELGLVAIPYARVAVVVAANASVPVAGLSREELLDLYAGRQTHWSDGSPVKVLQREAGDSSHLAAHAAIPGFEEVDTAALVDGRWRVLSSDQDMLAALAATPGSIGLVGLDLEELDELGLLILALDGSEPTQPRHGRAAYPVWKDLAFVIPEDQPDPFALDFIAFVFSSAGREVIRERGYQPIEPPERSPFAHLRAAGPPPGGTLDLRDSGTGETGETGETGAETEGGVP